MSDALIFAARCAFRDGSENLLIAGNQDGTPRKLRLEQARDDIARGFCPEAPVGQGEKALVRAVADAIMASWSLDARIVGPGTQARHIVDELFKHLKPEASE